jgi:acetyltransferase-like isoleucine patch superfamily enzyme
MDEESNITSFIMDRVKVLKGKSSIGLYQQIMELHWDLDSAFKAQFDRSLPLNEELIDRWERAGKLGFKKGTSIYDSSLVFGDVKVGESCWIGPFTIIDGSGGLEIGNYCTVSVGVQIYSHDNVRQTLTSGKHAIEMEKVIIGNNVYIGPNSIITRGVTIGNSCVIGACSLVTRDIPDNCIVFGQPAQIKGMIEVDGDLVNFKFNKTK